jgi:hypothetical protein
MERELEFTREVLEALGAPFPDDEIEFLPRAQSGGKALGLPYIDARSVMRRLDAVVGPSNWSFDFDMLSPDGKMIKGRLTVLGVTKCDAGEGSQEDEVLKSAVSDALKRCAVHFGIGRYLYYLPRVWAPYDVQKRRFTEQPRLDRAAVEHALQICGVSTGVRIGRSNGAGAEPARPMLRPAATAQTSAAPSSTEEDSSGRKSIWTAGAGGEVRNGSAAARTNETAVPESAGDRAASRPSTAVADRSVRPGAGEADNSGVASNGSSPMLCSRAECGKPLTKGQHDVSVRAFGQPLCPACQKLQARAA